MTHGAHRRKRSGPSKVLMGAVGVVAAAGVTAGVLLLTRPSVEPASSVTTPGPTSQTSPTPLFPDTPPLAVTMPAAEPPAPPPEVPVTTAAVVSPAEAPPPPPVQEPPVVPSPVATTAVVPEPVRTPAPQVTEDDPEATVVNPTPETRAPLSVEPSPRPAFPDQEPPELGDGRKGGLLGRGGLL